MLRTLSSGGSISIALRKLLWGGRRESGYIQVCNKGARQSVWASEIIVKQLGKPDIKLRNLAFFSVWEDASLWAHWINSFHMHLSYLGPILFSCWPCFLHSPSSSAINMRGGSIPWITVLGILIHIWRPEITDDCDISYLFIWQEKFSFYIWDPASYSCSKAVNILSIPLSDCCSFKGNVHVLMFFASSSVFSTGPCA